MSHRSAYRYTTNRLSTGDDLHWQQLGVCTEKGQDPELHYPIGTTGPALLQIEQAKANCRRCPVKDQCLQWALDMGDDHGIYGDTTPEERRAIKRRGGLRVLAAA